MVSGFANYTDEATRRKRRAMGLPDEPAVDENVVLLQEFEKRGLSPGPALALSGSPGELTLNLKARLAAEMRPGVQEMKTEADRRFNNAMVKPFSKGLTPEDFRAYRSVGGALLEGLAASGGASNRPSQAKPQVAKALQGVSDLTTKNPAVVGASIAVSPVRYPISVAGGTLAPKVAEKLGAPPAVQTAAGIAGSFAGYPEVPLGALKLAARGTGAVVKGAGQYAEQVGKSNVGNALMPAPPEARALARGTHVQSTATDVGDFLKKELPDAEISVHKSRNSEALYVTASTEDASITVRVAKHDTPGYYAELGWNETPAVDIRAASFKLSDNEKQEIVKQVRQRMVPPGPPRPLTSEEMVQAANLQAWAAEQPAAPGMGKSNVGNALLPAAPQTRVAGMARDLTPKELLASGEGGKTVGPAKFPPEAPPSGQYGFGGDILPPRPATLPGESADLNFRGQETTLPLNENSQEAFVESPASFANKAWVKTRQLNTPLAGKDYLLAEDTVQTQPTLTTPKGEELNLSGQIRRPPPPPSGKDAAGLPIEPSKPDAQLAGLEKPPIEPNIAGMKNIIPRGLAREDVAANLLLKPLRPVGAHVRHEVTTPLNRYVKDVANTVASRATSDANNVAPTTLGAFKRAGIAVTKDGQIPSLASVAPRQFKGLAPTVRDVINWMPSFEAHLPPDVVAALKKIGDTTETWSHTMELGGVGHSESPAVVLGKGQYVPRRYYKNAKYPQQAPIPKRNLFGEDERIASELAMKYTTEAEAIADGWKPLPLEEGLRTAYTDMGNRALQSQVADYLKWVPDEAGNRLSWDRTSGLGRGKIDLAELEGETFPAAMADAFNVMRRSEGPNLGPASVPLEVWRRVDNIRRGLRTTGELSWIGVQGLMGSYGNRRASAKAVVLSMKALRDPEVLARYKVEMSAKAVKRGLPPVDELISETGLAQQAHGGEFAIRGVGDRPSNLPVVKHLNRAQGYFTDVLRINITYNYLEEEMAGFNVFRKARTLQEIRASGDMKEIGRAVNGIGGWSPNKTGGDIGQFVLGFPRFLQSRLDTVGRGIVGLNPKSGLRNRIARRALFRMIGLGVMGTVVANEALGNDTDFRPVVNGRKNPNFLRVRVKSRDYSFFGTYDSLAALLINTVEGGVHHSPGDVLDAWRGQVSPNVSNVWDAATKETFNGKSLLTARDQAVNVAESILPFAGDDFSGAAQQAVSGVASGDIGMVVEAVGTAAGVAVGAKSSPVGFTDLADDLAKATYGKRFYDLPDHKDGTEGTEKAFIRTQLNKTRPDIALKGLENDLAGLDAIKIEYLRDIHRATIKSRLKTLREATSDQDIRRRTDEMLKEIERQKPVAISDIQGGGMR